MIRHARLTLQDEQLDQLHAIKRRLARERGRHLTLDDLLREGVDMLLRHHGPLSDLANEEPTR
jgi:hypothetical protein